MEDDMKKRISLILVVSLLTVALLACDKEKIETPVENPQETVQQETEDVQEVDADAMPEFSYTSVAYDEVYEYFSGSIQCIEITDSNHSKLADAVNDYFSEQVERFNKTCNNMVKAAEDANSQLEQDKVNNEGEENEFVYDYIAYYSYDISVEVTRCDNQMFSIRMDEYDYEGGAHGVDNIYGITFDTQTGEILENTCFEASVASIADTINSEIDSSPQEAKDLLTEDYQDYIHRMETGLLSSVAVWFNERGIVIGFPESTIAPHAAGIITFNVPYSKLEGFDEKYIPDGEFYTADISNMGLAEMIDINGDGNDEIVYLETTEDTENYTNTYILHIGEDEIKLSDVDLYDCDPMFVHCSTGNYFMITTTASNDWHTIHMYNADKNFAMVQSLDGTIKEIWNNKAKISYRVDAFGTWTAVKDYTYDGNGFSTNETYDKLQNDPRTNGNAMGITLLKNLDYTDENGDSETLKAGTVIYPITNYENQLEFVNKDGTIQGYFDYIYEDGVRYVNGVEEYKMFDNMPYAG